MQALSRNIRLIRGVSSACFAVVMALCFHLLGGGGLPQSPLVLLLPIALACLVCTLISSVQLCLYRLILSVSASQYLLHLVFEASDRAASLPALALDGAHHHGASSTAGATSAATSLAPHHAGHQIAFNPLSALPDHYQMFVSHALAVALTVAVFYRYELAVAHLRRSLAYALGRLAGLTAPRVPLDVRVRLLPVGYEPPVVSRVPTTGPQVRRGPPHPSFTLSSHF